MSFILPLMSLFAKTGYDMPLYRAKCVQRVAVATIIDALPFMVFCQYAATAICLCSPRDNGSCCCRCRRLPIRCPEWSPPSSMPDADAAITHGSFACSPVAVQRSPLRCPPFPPVEQRSRPLMSRSRAEIRSYFFAIYAEEARAQVRILCRSRRASRC